MRLQQIRPRYKELIRAVIETPALSGHKYDYDPVLDLFLLKKTLPLGSVFPFDFGFIPNTLAEDGDPLDVLVLADEPCYPGCLLECRPLGVLEAMQKERGQKKLRNDRIIAVSNSSRLYAGLQSLQGLGKDRLEQIITFFTNYNREEGRQFEVIRKAGARQVFKLIEKHTRQQVP